MVSNQQKVYDCNIPNFKVAIFTGEVSSPFPINRRVLPVEDMYNVIKKVHTDRGHHGRDGLYKALSQKYYGVTKSVCQIFTSQWRFVS